ncbi:MAG: hypothetical protein K2N68_00460, partial [Clostridia bacterium]|nr:hypothetical protein [Clostridia bacterium]
MGYYVGDMPNKKFNLKLKPHFGKVSIILIAVVAVLLTADLLTKYFEEAYNWNAVFISGFIEIQGGGLHRNTAAAFGGFDIGQPALI